MKTLNNYIIEKANFIVKKHVKHKNEYELKQDNVVGLKVVEIRWLDDDTVLGSTEQYTLVDNHKRNPNKQGYEHLELEYWVKDKTYHANVVTNDGESCTIEEDGGFSSDEIDEIYAWMEKYLKGAIS